MSDITQEKTERKTSFAEIYSKYGTAAVLFVIVVVASLLSPYFLTIDNVTNVLRQITVITIVGFGATFVIIVGQINIAYDSLLVLFGVIATMVAVSTGSVLLAILVAVAFGIISSLVFGLFVTRFLLPSFLVSLAIGTIARGAVLLITNAGVIIGLSERFKFLGQGYISVVPFPVIVMVAILLITWFVLSRMIFGRRVYAVGGNRYAAESSGIRTKRVTLQVFIIDGILTALASVVFMARLGSGQPNTGQGYAFDAITAVILGGASLMGGSGHVFGTVIGACIVGVINNIMNLMNVNSYWQLVVKGVIILVAVTIDVKTKQSIAKS